MSSRKVQEEEKERFITRINDVNINPNNFLSLNNFLRTPNINDILRSLENKKENVSIEKFGLLVEVDGHLVVVPESKLPTFLRNSAASLGVQAEISARLRERYHYNVEQTRSRALRFIGEGQLDQEDAAIWRTFARNRLRMEQRKNPLSGAPINAYEAYVRDDMDMPSYAQLVEKYTRQYLRENPGHQGPVPKEWANNKILNSSSSRYFDRFAKGARIAGWIGMTVNAGFAIERVVDAPAEQRTRIASQETGRFVGAGAGGAGGAYIFGLYGALLGSSIAPGPGTLVGGAIGSIFGGIFVSWAGGQVGEAIGDKIADSIEGK